MANPAHLHDALAAAAEEFLEEGYAYPIAARELRNTAPEYQAEASLKLFPRRRSADGFFLWLQHLIWLEGVLEIQPHLELTAEQVEGLRILRLARSRFLRSHPPCPHCGMPNDPDTFNCRDCLKKVKR